MKFNEWLSQAQDRETPELTEEAVIQNQLEQLANKVRGILHNVNEEQREELLDGFVEMLRGN